MKINRKAYHHDPLGSSLGTNSISSDDTSHCVSWSEHHSDIIHFNYIGKFQLLFEMCPRTHRNSDRTITWSRSTIDEGNNHPFCFRLFSSPYSHIDSHCGSFHLRHIGITAATTHAEATQLSTTQHISLKLKIHFFLLFFLLIPTFSSTNAQCRNAGDYNQIE